MTLIKRESHVKMGEKMALYKPGRKPEGETILPKP